MEIKKGQNVLSGKTVATLYLQIEIFCSNLLKSHDDFNMGSCVEIQKGHNVVK